MNDALETILAIPVAVEMLDQLEALAPALPLSRRKQIAMLWAQQHDTHFLAIWMEKIDPDNQEGRQGYA